MISSDREKATATFPPAGSEIHRWCRRALAAAALCGAVALAGLILFHALVPGLHDLAMFWISIVPLHVVAPAACMAVLSRQVPYGARLRALDLAPVVGKATGLLKQSLTYTALFYPVSIIVTLSAVSLLNFFGVERTLSPVLDYMTAEISLPRIASVVFVAVIVAPFAEEILFRLVLYEGLRLNAIRSPAVLSALAFAVMHAQPAEMPALFLLGLLLQHARRRLGSLWAPILIHMFFNAVSLGLILLHVLHLQSAG